MNYLLQTFVNFCFWGPNNGIIFYEILLDFKFSVTHTHTLTHTPTHPHPPTHTHTHTHTHTYPPELVYGICRSVFLHCDC